jgi:hypothetical protein
LEDVIIPIVLPKKNRWAIKGFSWGKLLEGGDQFNNISPLEWPFILLPR